MPEQIRLKVRIMIFTMVHSHLAHSVVSYQDLPYFFVERSL